jgi:hypothetical protein
MAFQGAAGADAVLSFAVGMRVALIAFDAVAALAAILLLLRTLRLHRLLHAEEQIHEHVGAWARLLLRGRPSTARLLPPARAPLPQPARARPGRTRRTP